MRRMLPLFLLAAIAAFCQPENPPPPDPQQTTDAQAQTQPQQTQPSSPDQQQQDERNRSVLEVKKGGEAIKNKDLWEESGYFHPFVRMPKYVLMDQKAIWTSPFHTAK